MAGANVQTDDGMAMLVKLVGGSVQVDGDINVDTDALEAALAGTLTIKGAAPAATATATIANAASLSGGVDLSAERLHRIVMPGTWTAAALTFQASRDGTNYNDLYTEFGEYQIASGVAGISREIVVDPSVFSGVRYLKVRSGTSAAAVNQGGSRDLILVTVPRI